MSPRIAQTTEGATTSVCCAHGPIGDHVDEPRTEQGRARRNGQRTGAGRTEHQGQRAQDDAGLGHVVLHVGEEALPSQVELDRQRDGEGLGFVHVERRVLDQDRERRPIGAGVRQALPRAARAGSSSRVARLIAGTSTMPRISRSSVSTSASVIRSPASSSGGVPRPRRWRTAKRWRATSAKSSHAVPDDATPGGGAAGGRALRRVHPTRKVTIATNGARAGEPPQRCRVSTSIPARLAGRPRGRGRSAMEGQRVE